MEPDHSILPARGRARAKFVVVSLLVGPRHRREPWVAIEVCGHIRVHLQHRHTFAEESARGPRLLYDHCDDPKMKGTVR